MSQTGDPIERGIRNLVWAQSILEALAVQLLESAGGTGKLRYVDSHGVMVPALWTAGEARTEGFKVSQKVIQDLRRRQVALVRMAGKIVSDLQRETRRTVGGRVQGVGMVNLNEYYGLDDRLVSALEAAVDMPLLADLWNAGLSMEEICKRIGRKRLTLYTWLRRLNGQGKLREYPRRRR